MVNIIKYLSGHTQSHNYNFPESRKNNYKIINKISELHSALNKGEKSFEFKVFDINIFSKI